MSSVNVAVQKNSSKFIEKIYRFKDPRALTWLLKSFLFESLFINSFILVFTFFTFYLLYRNSVGVYFSELTMSLYDTLMQFHSVFVILRGILIVISFIMLLIWIYRSNCNMRALKIEVKFSPILSVLSFFIPILGLWLPYRVIKELWIVENRSDRKNVHNSFIILCWWILFLSPIFLDHIAETIFQPDNLNALMNSLLIVLSQDITFVLANILCLIIVSKISSKQRRFFNEFNSQPS